MAVKKGQLTTKQRKFVKAKAQGKTGVAAAMEAYDTDDYNTANTIAVSNMQKPTIRQALDEAFIKAGITLDKPIQAIADGLEAAKQNEYTGEIVVDHSTRLKAAGMALNLMVPKQPLVEGGIHFHQHVEEKKGDYGF